MSRYQIKEYELICDGDFCNARTTYKSSNSGEEGLPAGWRVESRITEEWMGSGIGYEHRVTDEHFCLACAHKKTRR